ncbi:MAG: coproporphyrinogen-III oxidase family protein, partial [Pseudomonadota bacterium]
DLKALGRQHSMAEAMNAFDLARRYFKRVSFDLIYARVGQTTAGWEVELSRALAMAVDHLSLYQLTVEPGTRFFDLHRRGKLRVPEGDLAAEMYAVTQDLTADAGMPAYEISNHAALGAESRHNLVYWRYGDYAGIGPGAHGRITGRDGVRRATETTRGPAAYLAAVSKTGHAISAAEAVAEEDQAAEYLMMAMRLLEGADTFRYKTLAGEDLPEAGLAMLVDLGLVDMNRGRISATSDGRMVLNRVLSELLA